MNRMRAVYLMLLMSSASCLRSTPQTYSLDTLQARESSGFLALEERDDIQQELFDALVARDETIQDDIELELLVRDYELFPNPEDIALSRRGGPQNLVLRPAGRPLGRSRAHNAIPKTEASIYSPVDSLFRRNNAPTVQGPIPQRLDGYGSTSGNSEHRHLGNDGAKFVRGPNQQTRKRRQRSGCPGPSVCSSAGFESPVSHLYKRADSTPSQQQAFSPQALFGQIINLGLNLPKGPVQSQQKQNPVGDVTFNPNQNHPKRRRRRKSSGCSGPGCGSASRSSSVEEFYKRAEPAPIFNTLSAQAHRQGNIHQPNRGPSLSLGPANNDMTSALLANKNTQFSPQIKKLLQSIAQRLPSSQILQQSKDRNQQDSINSSAPTKGRTAKPRGNHTPVPSQPLPWHGPGTTGHAGNGGLSGHGGSSTEAAVEGLYRRDSLSLSEQLDVQQLRKRIQKSMRPPTSGGITSSAAPGNGHWPSILNLLRQTQKPYWRAKSNKSNATPRPSSPQEPLYYSGAAGGGSSIMGGGGSSHRVDELYKRSPNIHLGSSISALATSFGTRRQESRLTKSPKRQGSGRWKSHGSPHASPFGPTRKAAFSMSSLENGLYRR